jgi:anti-sigma B factor antagonist
MSRDDDGLGGGTGDGIGRAWYQVDQVGRSAVVRVGGEIDTRTAHRLDEAVTEAAGLASHVVIDLAQVTFVDSSGLGALIVARNTARERRGSVSLVSPPPVVRRLLGSTRLHDVFAIYDSLDEAVNATEPL